MESYPRGQVSLNGGTSRQATDYSHKITNGVKLKSTLRMNPGGWVGGAKAITGSMNMAIDANGEEFDFDAAVVNETPVLITLKAPGNVRKILEVKFTEVGEDFKVEDGVMKPVSFTGWFGNA